MKRLKDIELGRRERIWGEALRHQAGDGCTSGSDLLAFVEGRLSEKDRNRVIGHLGHCSGCRDTVFQLRATEKMLQPKSAGWLSMLSRNRFVLAGAAGFVLVAAVVWTRQPSPSVQGPSKVAINESQIPNPLFKEPSKKTTSGSTKPTEQERNVVKSSGTSTSPTRPTMNHTNTERSPERANKTGMGSESSTSKTLVAMGNAGTSFAGARAMKMCVLVGPNHAYDIGETDTKSEQRAQIEKQYADEIAADLKLCDEAVANGDDSGQPEEKLKTDLEEAARSRDSQIANLYNSPQDIRDAHPELQVEGDGPYQVVEVTYHAQPKQQVPVFEEFVVVAPWSGYVSVDIPFGWQYGQHYHRDDFRGRYSAWRGSHIGPGRPVFHGLIGFNGAISAGSITRTAGGGIAYRSTSIATAGSRSSERPGYSHSAVGSPGPRRSFVPRSAKSTAKYGGSPNRLDKSSVARPNQSSGPFGRPNNPSSSATAQSKYSHGGNRPTGAGHTGDYGRTSTGSNQGSESKYSHQRNRSGGGEGGSSGLSHSGSGRGSDSGYSGSGTGHSSSYNQGRGTSSTGSTRRQYGTSGSGSASRTPARPTGGRSPGQSGGRSSGASSHGGSPRRGGRR